ncbi:MAG: CopG family antitoxin [Hyphomicrobiales bacterium]|nr:CopG family antitoxin [Hyphomicrobiales bacterium]
MKRKWPVLGSDEQAERFVEEADLSDYDFADMVPVQYEFEPKAAAFNMRLPSSLLEALKSKAKAKGIPFTRYVRLLIEQDVAR